jgi:uncharacterized membrane protein YhfC
MIEQLTIIIALSSLILLFYYIFIRKRPTQISYCKIFLIGTAGWTVAYLLRLIPLQLIQLGILYLLGANIQDPTTFTQYTLNPWLLIWGPLFAGLFEGYSRYICTHLSKELQNERKKAPFLLGLGWTSAEIILIVFLPLIFTSSQMSWFNVTLAIWERIVASILHISLCYIVVYVNFEPEKRRPSLWLTMSIHAFFDGTIVIWMIFGHNLAVSNPTLYVILIEVTFTIMACLLIVFTWKYWIPRSEKLVSQTQLQQNRPLPETKKDDIKIQNLL